MLLSGAPCQLLRIHLPGTPVNKDIMKGPSFLAAPPPSQMLIVYESRSLRSPFFSFALPFL